MALSRPSPLESLIVIKLLCSVVGISSSSVVVEGSIGVGVCLSWLLMVWTLLMVMVGSTSSLSMRSSVISSVCGSVLQ